MEFRELVEIASTNAGSARELARRLHVTEQRLSEWKNGHRPCPPKAQALIAQAAGQDARKWLWEAVMGKAASIALTIGAAAMLNFGCGERALAAAGHGTNDGMRPNV